MKKKGMTLVEVIISMSLLAICILMFSLILRSNMKLFNIIGGKYEVNNSAKLASNNILSTLKYCDEIITRNDILNNDKYKNLDFTKNIPNSNMVFYLETSYLSEVEKNNEEKQLRFVYVLKDDEKYKNVRNLYRYQLKSFDNKVFVLNSKARVINEYEFSNYFKLGVDGNIQYKNNQAMVNDNKVVEVLGELDKKGINSINPIFKPVIFKPHMSEETMVIYKVNNGKEGRENFEIAKVKEQSLEMYSQYNKLEESSVEEILIANNIKNVDININSGEAKLVVTSGCREKDKEVQLLNKVSIDRFRRDE